MKGKKKIIISVILIIIFLVAGFYPVVVKKVTSELNISKGDTIKVYLLSEDRASFALLTRFKNSYMDIKVEEVIFDNPEELYTRMSSDAFAGEGPDIIFGNGASLERVTKLIDSGIFLDLNPVMNEDDTFFIEDYNKEIMDAGVYDNKRLFVPINYNVSSIITTKGILDYCGIEGLDGDENLEEIIKASSNYLNNKDNEDERVFCKSITSFTDFLDSCGIEAIDYRGKKADFSNEKVIELMEAYKNIYLRNNGLEEDNVLTFQEANSKLADKKVIFSYFPIGASYRHFTYSNMKSVMEEDPIVFPLYNNGTAKIGTFMAINSNTKNVEGAYKFLRIALSYGAQMDNPYEGISVNNRAYIRSFQDEKNQIGRTYDKIKIVGLPEELEKAADSASTSFDKVILEDITIDKFINEEIELYIEGKKTAKTAAADMQNKVTLYLNE